MLHEFIFKEYFVIFMQKYAIYILGAYNLECFDYLLRSFDIGLKENCLHFVQKQLQALTEMVYPCLFVWHTCMYNCSCYNAGIRYGGSGKSIC